jgi:hypothetical protein
VCRKNKQKCTYAKPKERRVKRVAPQDPESEEKVEEDGSEDGAVEVVPQKAAVRKIRGMSSTLPQSHLFIEEQ